LTLERSSSLPETQAKVWSPTYGVNRALRQLYFAARRTALSKNRYWRAAAKSLPMLMDLQFEARASPEACAIIGRTLRAIGLMSKRPRIRAKSVAALKRCRPKRFRKFTDEALLAAAPRAPHMAALVRTLKSNRKSVRARVEEIQGHTDLSALLAMKPWLRRVPRRRSHANEMGLDQQASSERAAGSSA
jgi:hypothetical protein